MKNTLIFTFCLFILSSCSKSLTPFSQRLYEEYNWSDTELKKIQFYLSDDIVLRRSVGSNETAISNGKIRIVDGKKVEEVIFRKGTPGVYVFSPRDNRFGISFESDDDGYLMFGPNPKQSERYVLLAKEWDRSKGKVTYKNNTYNTSSRSAYTTLMVDLNKANKTKYQSTTVGGRKVK